LSAIRKRSKEKRDWFQRIVLKKAQERVRKFNKNPIRENRIKLQEI
jgi:hypothetical protein